MCHLFMFSALAFLGFPDGLINAIAALCADGALQGPGAEEVPLSGVCSFASWTRSCDVFTRFCRERASA